MARYLSLFRGINVGGRQLVRMDDLKALHLALGLQDVTTYIQSGNVLFSSDDVDLTELPLRIEEAFAEKFGFRVRVMVRAAEVLDKIIAANPFKDQPGKETKHMIVLFLTTWPDVAAFEALRQGYTGPEEMFLIGQELYIYYAEGIGRSKLSLPMIEKKLKTAGTARNMNTILQLQNR